jgi:hypothetical protein
VAQGRMFLPAPEAADGVGSRHASPKALWLEAGPASLAGNRRPGPSNVCRGLMRSRHGRRKRFALSGSVRQ